MIETVGSDNRRVKWPMRCDSECDKNIFWTYSALCTSCGNDIRIKDLRGVVERSVRPITAIWYCGDRVVIPRSIPRDNHHACNKRLIPPHFVATRGLSRVVRMMKKVSYLSGTWYLCLSRMTNPTFDSDPAVKQILLVMNEKQCFIIEDLDDHHLVIKADGEYCVRQDLEIEVNSRHVEY